MGPSTATGSRFGLFRTLRQVGVIDWGTVSLDLDATLGALVDAAHEPTVAEASAILLQDGEGWLVIRIGRGRIAASVGERVSGHPPSAIVHNVATSASNYSDDLLSEAVQQSRK